MPITPEAMDWTWVLDRRCPDCGFDATTFDPTQTPVRVRALADSWRRLLTDRRDVATRPDDSTWSPLEYGCHVRDIFRLYAYRLQLMLEFDEPTFPNWDQDETSVAEKYGQQDPRIVAGELCDAAEILADAFAAVDGPQWQRTGHRSDNKHFTIDSFARYMVHDPVHHVWDVEHRRVR